MPEIFEQALRNHIRFPTPIGLLTTEDLWELPLTSKNRVDLDDIARALNRALKSSDDVSFVDDTPQRDATLQLRFDIVRHVIGVKLEERKKTQEESERAARKQKLLAILADREDADLRAMPVDELRKMLTEL